MRSYEVVLIVVHQVVESRQKELVKRLDSIFAKHQATVQGRHDRGKQLLGYPMKKHNEGHIYIYNVDCEPSKVQEMIHDLRLENDLLQVMFTHPIAQASLRAKKEAVTSGR